MSVTDQRESTKIDSDNSSIGFYAVIPIRVIKNKNLTANAKLLYGILSGLVREKGYCWAKNEFLAAELSVSNRMIQYMLNELIKENEVSIDPGRSKDGTWRKIFLTIATQRKKK